MNPALASDAASELMAKTGAELAVDPDFGHLVLGGSGPIRYAGRSEGLVEAVR